ncbi:MAG: NmrA family NAD(P)-binding protein, partial [Actinobacteria bacterium]|nr:NmrA family NAD(P)-binding protein [Actinomycetota bacterium]
AGTAHAAGAAADTRHGRNIIDAARAARAGHLVYITVAGASRPTGVPIIDSKHGVEQNLRGSGVPHTIIAPAYFMENAWNPWNQAALAAGRWPSPVTRSRLLQQIPLADVLAFTAHVLESRDTMFGQRIEIASDQLTADQAAAVISGMLGRTGAAAEPPGQANPLFRWLEHAGPAVDITELRRRYPHIGWHTFAEWAATQDWHWLAGPQR